MTGLLGTIEQYLISAGAMPVLQEDTLVSNLTVAGITYSCNFWADDDQLGMLAEWCEGVPMDRFDETHDLLVRLVNAGDGAGQTLLNRRTGQVVRRATVDLSMVTATPEKIGMMVETILRSFGGKMKLMKRVLDGAVTPDSAVKMVEESTKEASAQRMDQLRQLFGTDEAA